MQIKLKKPELSYEVFLLINNPIPTILLNH